MILSHISEGDPVAGAAMSAATSPTMVVGTNARKKEEEGGGRGEAEVIYR